MKEYFKAIKAEFPYVGVREKKFLNDFTIFIFAKNKWEASLL